MSHCDHPGLRPVEAVLQQLLDSIERPASLNTEKVSLTAANRRVLAVEISSSIDVPPADNSAVDGYALNTRDLIDGDSTELPVSARIPAGAVTEALESGTAARIFTGASVPAGADTVVMQEDCETLDNGRVRINSKPPAGNNIRPRGQDIHQGKILFQAGHRLRPQDCGLLASVGIGKVEVYRPLKVAILSSGDELAEPGQPLTDGQIYNSNRYQLNALLLDIGVEVVDCGICEDTLDATRSALSEAAERADIVITSGGVSVGEEDHLKQAVSDLGQLELWRLAIKPGKPLAFGYIGDTPWLGLPGNPGAVFVTFCVLALPVLRKMQGIAVRPPATLQVPLDFDIRKPGRRREYLRVRLTETDKGPRLASYPNQSSGVLSSASWGSGLAVIRENTCPKAGDLVDYLPFSSLLGQD